MACRTPQGLSWTEGLGSGNRQKYEIYMEATALARIDDANTRSSVQLAGMHAEVDSEKEKHDLLMKQQKVSSVKVNWARTF